MNYLTINPNISMFLTKNAYNIIIKEEINNKKTYDYFSINKSGKLILEIIDGTQELDTIVNLFIRKYSLLKEDRYWIIEFLMEMIDKKIVFITQKAEESPGCLVVFGETNLISPMHVTIEITEKCNLYCSHCYLNASCIKTDVMDYSSFKLLVTKLKKNKVLSLELTGGEIFMNKDVDAILELAFEEFAQVAILTNGTILKKSSLDILKRNKKKLVVSISLDSVTEEIHDSFRGAKGAFKKTCRNIQRLSNEGIHVRVASSIFDKNMWEIDKLAELSKRLGAEIFVYNFIEDFGRGTEFNESSSITTTRDYQEYLNETVSKYKDIIPIIESEFFLKTSSNCGAGTNSFLVGAKGDIRPCALFPKNKLFGNIFKDSFSNIFSRDIYRKLSEINPPNVENGCELNCPKYLSCLGCYMKGLENNYNKKIEEYCGWIKKNNLEVFIQEYRKGRES